METNIVREVAEEMLNTSMQEITAERIHGWATRLGQVAVAKSATTTPTCKESLQVQTMDEWAYPLTNVCKCGNGQEPKQCATVKDANGVVLLHFNGIPWRSNKDSTAMATEFCDRMNAQGNKVGNAAKMREALEKVIEIAKREWNAFRETSAMFEMHEICTAALAAPARNCDKYLTPKDAILAHLEEVYEGEKVEFGDYEWCEFVKWLFAEAKGE